MTVHDDPRVRQARSATHVLIVDDDRDFADTLGQLLKLEGFEVEITYSIAGAKLALGRSDAEIALIDIRMGDGNGLSLVSDIRQTHPDLTCIMMTAYASVETAVATLQEGAYDYLRKPFYTQDLMATIERCLERRSLMRERDRAEASLKLRNRDLETLNTRLQGLVSSMQTLSSCTTLRDLGKNLLHQVTSLTNAKGGAVSLMTGENIVIRHGPGLAADAQLDATDREFDFPLLGAGREPIGTMTLEASPEHPLSQENHELTQILVSYASEAVHLLQALDRVSWSEARLRDIIDHSPSLISLQDLAGRFLIVNQRFEEWHGHRHQDVVGKTANDVLSANAARSYSPQGDQAGNGEQMVDEEIEITFADGSIHSLLMTRFPVRAGDGRLIGIGTIATDVTERRSAEEHLRQAQKMEALGQLTGGVAHDFNNLLAVIYGNLSLIGHDLQGPPELLELLEDASAATQAGADLTHRLLAFGRRQTLHPQPTDTRELLVKMFRVLQRTLGEAIVIEAGLNDELWPIEVDRSQLETSLLNLALNARDAMPEGGALRIAAQNVTRDRPVASGSSGSTTGSFVMIAVSDTGSGMAADVLARAVQPFFTTKSVGRGSGLGLSMVYGFAEQSGGHLDIASVVGEGTTVRLWLPKAQHQARTIEVDEGQWPQLASSGKRVLVVEDKPDVRRLAKRILTKQGYDVLEAGDGSAALALLADTPDVDLLFTDIVLPGGMSGVELAELAQDRHPGLKILYTSGYAPEAVFAERARREEILLIRKPFHSDDLARMVRQALDIEVLHSA